MTAIKGYAGKILWLVAAPVVLTLLAGLFATPRVVDTGLALRGATILRVIPGLAGDQAGLNPGDVILSPPLPQKQFRQMQIGDSVEVTVERKTRSLTLYLQGIAPGQTELFRRWLVSLAGLSFLSLGLYTALRRPQNGGAQFAGFALAWAMLLHAPLPAGNIAYTLLEVAEDLAQLALGPLLVHFLMVFPQPSARFTTGRVWLLYSPAIIMALVSIVHLAAPLGTAAENALQASAAAYFLVCILGAGLRFVRTWLRTVSSWDRRRLRAMLIGTGVAFLPVLLGFLPGQAAQAMFLDTLAPLFLMAIPISYAYAIVRYEALGATDRDRLDIVPGGVLVVIGLGGLLALVSANRVIASPWILALLAAGVSVVLLLLHGRLKHWATEVRVGEAVHREVRNYEQQLVSMLSEQGVMGSLLSHIDELLKPAVSVVFRLAEGGDSLRPWPATVPSVALDSNARQTLSGLRRMTTRRELGQVLPQLKNQLGTEVLVPIPHKEGLTFLGLNPPRGKIHFSSRERVLLTRLAVRAAGAMETARAHEAAVSQERVLRDLEVARGIQARLLPAEPPLRQGVDLDAFTMSCEAVGGDFYDWIDFDDGRVGIAVGDVSGKGISASLLMAAAHSAFHAEAAPDRSPGEVLSVLNRTLLERHGNDRFVCMFYGILNPSTGRLVYSNAGVEAPILLGEDGSMTVLTDGGLVLGVLPESEYPESVLQLQQNQRLIVFTDGLLEVLVGEDSHPEEDFPGYKVLAESAVEGRRGARETRRRLLLAAELSDTERNPDDATVVVARWLG